MMNPATVGTLSMFDPREAERQLGGQIKKLDHVNLLKPIEDYVRANSPLPIAYDVGRTQPWYFTEFNYTEFCGGMLILPQTDELAVRIIERSRSGAKKNVDVCSLINKRVESFGTGDKYELEKTDATPRKIAILPGSNLMTDMVSRELLSRAMFENDDLMIKPHPLTNDAALRMLKIEFGANRILPARASAWSLLRSADEVYTAPCSEMGAYAVMLGKQTHNIANFLHERGASYFPVMWNVLGKPRDEAREVLLEKLNAFSSGIVFPQDPQFREQIDAYFSEAMAVREQFKPMVWGSHKPVIYKNALIAN